MRKYFKIRKYYEIIIDLKIITFKTTTLDREHNPQSEVVITELCRMLGVF